MTRAKKILAAAAAAALFAGVIGGSSAVAQQQQQQGQQQQGQQGQQDRGGRGGRGNFDPAEMRQRMMDRMKEQLAATDDEWKVIQPRLEKVMAARQGAASGGGGFGGFGIGGGRGGADGGGRGGDRGGDRGGFGGRGGDANSPVAQASLALRTAVENQNTSAEELGRKIQALRDARVKAREELTKAQAELKELLTQRQEAQLVMAGMLE